MNDNNFNSGEEKVDSTPTAVKKKPRGKYIPWTFKQRLPLALLAAFALPFTVVFYGVFEIYAGNRAEFDFALVDVLGNILLVFAIAFAALAAILLILRGRAFDVAFAVIFWLGVMAYIQGNFLNFGMSSLAADEVGHGGGQIGLIILDVAIWVIALAASLFAVLFVRNREWIHTGAVILLVMVIGMQLTSFAVTAMTSDVLKPLDEQTDLESDETLPDIITDEEGSPETDAPAVGDETEATEVTEQEETEPDDTEAEIPEDLVLTTKNLFTLSSKKNVIVFMVDRFDVCYVNDVLDKDPEFFDRLDGFTYYSDNISKYPRTYPAVASMISGIENDFSGSASSYFERAYQSSEFLKTLKQNDFKVNIYSDSFYTYRDAKELLGVADNISVAGEYTVENKGDLTKNLIGLSAYRYVPLPAKELFTLSTTSFKGFVKYDSDYPQYVARDYEFYEMLTESGLSVSDDGKNNYSFICFNGCHSPYHLDENAEYVSSGNSLDATFGVFKIIYQYLDYLKELGLYKDATIIITGDHANPIDDYTYLEGVRQTALFFKPSGSSEDALAYSSAQVSQDNLIPSIIESVGIESDIDFGECYWDIPEGENRTRRYLLIKSSDPSGHDLLVEYAITGAGDDFSNWEIVKETDIGYLYK